jgi:hypothetical protein
MPECSGCGQHAVRVHRTLWERLVYADAYRCSACGLRARRMRRSLQVRLTFWFSRHTHCIRCGSAAIERPRKRDRVDAVSGNVLSRLQRLTGAPLNRCGACRVRYYDWRRPRAAEPVTRATSTLT